MSRCLSAQATLRTEALAVRGLHWGGREGGFKTQRTHLTNICYDTNVRSHTMPIQMSTKTIQTELSCFAMITEVHCPGQTPDLRILIIYIGAGALVTARQTGFGKI